MKKYASTYALVDSQDELPIPRPEPPDDANWTLVGVTCLPAYSRVSSLGTHYHVGYLVWAWQIEEDDYTWDSHAKRELG